MNLSGQRHKTAMKRASLSRPITSALRDRVIRPELTLFDYGCGYGTDVEILRSTGLQAEGWDPYFDKDKAKIKSDIINLGYVLNVIEDINERLEVLKEAFDLSKKVLIVSVRIDDAVFGTELGDGGLTRDGAFQKIYTQAEFRSYVEDNLKRKLYISEPGVGYVFKDEQFEDEYKSNKYLGRLSNHESVILKQIHDAVDPVKIAKLIEDLGRIPDQEEVGELSFLGKKRFKDFIESSILPTLNQEKYNESKKRLEEDVLQALAMTRIENRDFLQIRQLPLELQRTVRVLFGDYKEACRQAEAMLFSLGKEGEVAKQGRASPVGKLLPEDLYVHISALEYVPGLLKLMLSLAESIAGKIQADIVKFSLHGKSLSFLFYPDFDTDPHPKLVASVKVDFRTGKYKLRDYSKSENPPILHRKESFVLLTYHKYLDFKTLTEVEEAAGLLSANNIGFKKQWEEHLSGLGFEFVNNEIKKKENS